MDGAQFQQLGLDLKDPHSNPYVAMEGDLGPVTQAKLPHRLVMNTTGEKELQGGRKDDDHWYHNH